jgi:hypothetical protein
MPNMKEAIILTREAWEMASNQTIYICWKKAGIIDIHVQLNYTTITNVTLQSTNQPTRLFPPEQFRINGVRVYLPKSTLHRS